jgi:para-nitrobenzyl esterase
MRAGLALAAAFVAAIAGPAAGQDRAPIVRVEQGRLTGTVQDGIAAWRGVPYAAAPVGPLRWRPPQAPARWSGLRAADALSPDCMQGRMPNLPGVRPTPPAPLSEDCLYLNVWRPQTTPRGEKLPVIVWIHGGAFVNGGSSDPVTWGNALARRDLVVVTFNYRLGRLGFFAHPELTAEHPEDGRGNYGLMDQVAALKWVRRNIAAFGGDPANVTVMGESAGGIAINLLLGARPAEGLFDKGVILSGAGRDFLGGGRSLSQDAPGALSAESQGRALATRLGANDLAALRALPADRITGDLNMVTLVIGGPAALFSGPILDGQMVSRSLEAQYRANGQRPMPVIVGATSADLSLERASTKDAAFAQFGDRADEARRLYDPAGDVPIDGINRAIGADRNMIEPARFVARSFASQGAPVFEYRFGYVAQEKRAAAPWGADHASDVPYAFDRVQASLDAPTATDQATATRFADYLARFARTGNPNGPGLPQWPIYGADTDQLMSIRPDGAFVGEADPLKARLDLMQGAADRRWTERPQ